MQTGEGCRGFKIYVFKIKGLLLVRRTANKHVCHYQQRKLSTLLFLVQLKKLYGYVRYYRELKDEFKNPTTIIEDNQAAIKLAKNPPILQTNKAYIYQVPLCSKLCTKRATDDYAKVNLLMNTSILY